MKHLASYNVWREGDGSLWVTISEAKGVQNELGMASGMVPLHMMAMRALTEAVKQTNKRLNDSLSETIDIK